MIIEAIKWPLAKNNSDDSEDDIAPATVSAIARFFQTFIEQGSSLHINLNIYTK